MAEKTAGSPTRDDQRLANREPVRVASPFRTLERFADQMDRIFEDFGFGRSAFGGNWFGAPQRVMPQMWAPDVEISQHDNELVLRADLPGLNKDDVSIDVTDEGVTISGERRQEQESERGGVYRSERTYGSFRRTIPLPDGAMADQAKATFKNGVLEITMPAPPEQVRRGRRLTITEGGDAKK
jgi:HSP20 family protein